MCHHRLCRRPGLCNLQKQESRLTREDVRAAGKARGLPCDPIPGGNGDRSPAGLPGPTVCPFPRSPGWPQKTSGDAERAWRWWGLSAHGEKAGEEREHRRGSKPQFWPEKAGKQPSKRALMPLGGPVRRHPREDGCATGYGKDPGGSGHSVAGLCLRMERTSCPYPVNWSHLCVGELGLWTWIREHLSCKQRARDSA